MDDSWARDVDFQTDSCDPNPTRYQRVPFCRRRVGRGGRIIFDRHIHLGHSSDRHHNVQDNELDPWQKALHERRFDSTFSEIDESLRQEELSESAQYFFLINMI